MQIQTHCVFGFRQQLLEWINRGEPFAIATVVRVEGSVPRAPGATLLISASGDRFVGSVSAGCLDNEVIHAAAEVLAGGGHRMLRFGPDGAPPWQDGLSCGGYVEVRIDPWFTFMPRAEMKTLAEQIHVWLRAGSNAVILSRGDDHFGLDLAGKEAGDRDKFLLEERDRARACLAKESVCSLEESAETPYFIRTLVRSPRLFIVGAVDTAAHLVAFSRHSGFECIVIDPRSNYARPERFHVAPDRLINAWPQEFSTFAPNQRDAALVLSHDPKIDDLALIALLKTGIGYIGALGSQRSHATRLERLKTLGATETELARIEGPAGVRLGASDSVGIALGMMAGVVRSQAARGVWR
jgi:xanthine dehydrogenase accessory factor